MKSKFLLLLVLILSGCAVKTDVIKPTPITIPTNYGELIPIPKVEPTNIKSINWILLTKKEMIELLNQSGDILFYALDEQNSLVLNTNMQDLKRYIQSQQEVIKYLINVLNARSNDKD